MAGAGVRAFVAVDVGDDVRREVTRVVSTLTAKLEAVKKPPKVVWVRPQALHVTIKFLGELDPHDVDRIQDLLAPPISMEPFQLEWRGTGTFPSNRHPRALWLGVVNGAAPLARLEAEVSRRLAAEKAVEIEDRAFLPHLTIGRVKMPGEGIDWPKLLQAVEVKRVSSTVDRVTLYRSVLSQHGPNYTGLVSSLLLGNNDNQ
jgi:RNA 2',3'-cyclic 3'-phosphodiesterase